MPPPAPGAHIKTFTELMGGRLLGVLRWEQWDVLCRRIASGGEPWYVYAVGHGVPEAPHAGERLAALLAEIDALLRRDHREDYLGIAYADDLDNPSLVKIYDPKDLGSSCGSSGRVIPPGWVLSRPPPVAIASDLIVPDNRRRWWEALMERISPKAGGR